MTLEERLKQLEKIKNQIPNTIKEIAKNATLKAVEAATEKTPPTEGELRGTNAISGELKQHWSTDSKIEPTETGGDFVTELNNNKEYASYVNDGHRMDRHFVPGLYINPYSGLLEFDASRKVGIVVGTKTAYVNGLYMKEAGIEEYKKEVNKGVKKLEELLK